MMRSGGLVLAIAAAVAAVPLAISVSGQPAASPPSPARPSHAAATSPDRVKLAPGRELTVFRPDGASERVTSLLNVPRRMAYGDYTWADAGVPAGKVWVRVDLGAQLLSVFRSGQEIGTAVIIYGAPDKPTPTGWLTVQEKRRDHYSRTYDAPMPFMLRLTDDGVAIHASAVLSGRATHGCIGIPDAFARKLYDAMNKGDAVLVVGGEAHKA